MNCIWLLLILFCGGCNNNCGSNWSNNSCDGNYSDYGRRNTGRCNDCDNCNCDCDRNRNTREAIREAVRDAVCDNNCDNRRDRDDDDCNCRRTYNFPNYPVLNDCD